MHSRFYFSRWSWLWCGVSAAWAQPVPVPVPDAGSVMQQIEGGQRPKPPTLQRQPTAPAGPSGAPAGRSVTLSAIRFQGNTVVPTAQLEVLVAPWLGQPLAFSELEQMARAVTAAYRQAGYLARAEFAPQDLTEGVATLRITEGQFGNVRIEGERLSRLPPDKLQQLVDAVQPKGDLVRTSALDRALLLADDLPGASVTGKLEPGSQPGETDLVLNTQDEPLLSGKVVGDNAGARATGTARIYGRLGWASPLSLGDQATVGALHSEGSDYVHAAYSLPVGPRGLQLGLAASHLDYRLVSPEYQTLDASGRSTIFEGLANYPVIRSPAANLFAGVALADKRYYNQASGIATSDYTVRTASLGLWGNRLDQAWSGGWSSGSLYWVFGDLDLSGSPNQSFDAAGPQAAGTFNVLRLQAAHQQPLQILGSQSTALNLRYSAQWANKNLDSSEKFYLGGPNGVRAYPVSEAGGSEGQIVNLELQTNLSANLRLMVFVDWGQVTVNRKPWGLNGQDRYDLSGAGLGLDLLNVRDVQLQLVWARRFGSNPRPLLNGHDQDGSYKRNRFWLTAGLSF